MRLAQKSGDTYMFQGADGSIKEWLKGDAAYLAPAGASALLNRCSIKHDWVSETDVSNEVLEQYDLLVVADAAYLPNAVVEQIVNWSATTEGTLMVTGRTNLPNEVLGAVSRNERRSNGFAAWALPVGSPVRESVIAADYYLAGYPGHCVFEVQPAEDVVIAADLLDILFDPETREVVSQQQIGPAVLLGPRTVYVASEVFEFLAGCFQAHLDMRKAKHRVPELVWGDATMLVLQELLLRTTARRLWGTRLKAFGTYSKAVSIRHDVHGPLDFAMLEYEAENILPATYDIEDPVISSTVTHAQASEWVRRTSEWGFLEPALHNDAAVGDPPTYMHGAGLLKHVRDAEKHFGVPIESAGRHGGFHMHPETLDAMDYMYQHDEKIFGMCTFCYYMMIEYGVRDPDVELEGLQLTYVSDVRDTIAGHGFWFPYHPVVTTVSEWRPMRGWDRTHELDCSYATTDMLLRGKLLFGTELPNGVYSVQYHPDYSSDVSKNGGRGTLDYLRYLIAVAKRDNCWIVNRRDLYKRLRDYEEIRFRAESGGRVVIQNGTGRTIRGLGIESVDPIGRAWAGDSELLRVLDDRLVTVPPLEGGETLVVEFRSAGPERAVRVGPGDHEGLAILDARRIRGQDAIEIRASVCRGQRIRIDGLESDRKYTVEVDGEPRFVVANEWERSHLIWLGFQRAKAFVEIPIDGGTSKFVDRKVRVAPEV